MNDCFSDLFYYNYEANNRYNVTVNQIGVHNDRIYQLLSHIYNIHHIWLSRILGKSPDFDPWELHTPDLFQIFNNKNFSDTKRILQQKIDFNQSKVVHYQMNDRHDSENTIGEILHHILFHSNYHRGQLAHEITLLEYRPPDNDFLNFKKWVDGKRKS